jgi:hypothetical protein
VMHFGELEDEGGSKMGKRRGFSSNPRQWIRAGIRSALLAHVALSGHCSGGRAVSWQACGMVGKGSAVGTAA